MSGEVAKMSAQSASKTEAPAIASVRDRVEHYLARIEADNPHLHAVSTVFADAALERAATLDLKALKNEPLGPLHGMPILFKELVDVAGYPTRFGSQSYASSAALRNAPVIDRLEAAGAVILGTTHMVEFAVGSWGTNAVRGTPQNPADWTKHRVPGGSSSGSAVAVAAGFAPVAFGSDTGGSVRIPASLCGVVGYKPSYGLISLQGVAPTGPSFDTLGPLSTNVTDARLTVEAAAGVSLSHQPLGLKEVTFVHVPMDDLEPIDTASRKAYDQALGLLVDAGAALKATTLPMSFVDLQKVNGDIVAFEAYRHLKALIDDQTREMDPFVRRRVLHGSTVSEGDYRQRLKTIHELRVRLRQSLSVTEILVLPGTPMPATTVDDVDESAIPMSRYTRAANCLDMCAIALPMPIGEHDLPVGIQFSAISGQDARLLSVAASFERLFIS